MRWLPLFTAASLAMAAIAACNEDGVDPADQTAPDAAVDAPGFDATLETSLDPTNDAQADVDRADNDAAEPGPDGGSCPSWPTI